MTDFHLFTKDALLDEIGRAWDELNHALDDLTPEQMSGPTDANGWRVQDHLSHMGAWHNWARLRPQGWPTWEGLGITDNSGFESTATYTVRVGDPPAVSIDASAKTGPAPLAIDFTADVSSGDTDTANAAIRARHAAKTPAEARAFLTETHDLLLAHIAGLDESVLPLPFRALGPDEPADRVIPPVSHIVYESTAGHYREHLGWLRSYAFGAGD